MQHDNKTTLDGLPVWGGPAQIFWRDDCFGKPARALYIGGLNIGTIYHSPVMFGPGGGQLVNEKPWRAWLMTDEDGKCVGWFLTEREAKSALLDAAVDALVGESA